MNDKSNIEVCTINCNLSDVPILYINGRKGQWKRVKCNTNECPYEVN